MLLFGFFLFGFFNCLWLNVLSVCLSFLYSHVTPFESFFIIFIFHFVRDVSLRPRPWCRVHTVGCLQQCSSVDRLRGFWKKKCYHSGFWSHGLWQNPHHYGYQRRTGCPSTCCSTVVSTVAFEIQLQIDDTQIFQSHLDLR